MGAGDGESGPDGSGCAADVGSRGDCTVDGGSDTVSDGCTADVDSGNSDGCAADVDSGAASDDGCAADVDSDAASDDGCTADVDSGTASDGGGADDVDSGGDWVVGWGFVSFACVSEGRCADVSFTSDAFVSGGLDSCLSGLFASGAAPDSANWGGVSSLSDSASFGPLLTVTEIVSPGKRVPPSKALGLCLMILPAGMELSSVSSYLISRLNPSFLLI